ncbi:alpha-taxilin isoform X2 [Mastacembelus armatus]|uniref:alpha-taxilin isoform X2 n=1 Tax=Mastacembelus armatus TaxID=205130 RepID=UPI000E458980|nr:beta-taxilin isoform X2 [Mastacembelus armatus]
METSAKVLVPPQPDMASSSSDTENTEPEAAAAACASSSDFFDPMEEFSRRLEDIVGTYGSAADVLDTQDAAEAALEITTEEAKEDVKVAMETEVALVTQSLNHLPTPEEKLEELVRKYAELAALRHCDEKKLCVLQRRVSVLLEDRRRLQAERCSSDAARSKLEALCIELQGHYSTLRGETLQRRREDEEKRHEITSHFQMMLTEIQAQIEQHSARNDKLCRENANLTDKLESLMSQCELREESLEKINRHRDLQHKLTEAKLQQATALLAEAEDKHKREKEYLLREAIDKTKKCFAMKEQELAMKKKLTLYGQKFDEFQATLAKSNEIYVRFKEEMEQMSDKMKKLERESNVWKTRFENCNKALTDMIEERTEKGKEFDLFVLKIQKLEKLCRVLQDERKILYDKIKEVRLANLGLPSKVLGSSNHENDPDKPALLTPVEIQELQEEDLVLTEDMTRLREEQAKLQEFAASLLASPIDNDEDDCDIDLEEDIVASAFVHFKTKTQVKEEPVSVPEQVVKADAAELDLKKPDKAEEAQKPDPRQAAEKAQVQVEIEDEQQVKPGEEIQLQQEPTPEAEVKVDPPTDPRPAAEKAQVQVEVKDEQQVKPAEEIQLQQEPTPEAEVKVDPPTDPRPAAEKAQVQVEVKDEQQVKPAEEIQLQQEPTPEADEVPTDPRPVAAEAAILEDTGEAEPVSNEKVQQQQAEPLQASAEIPSESKAAPPKAAASSTKQVPKKKKKRSKNVS